MPKNRNTAAKKANNKLGYQIRPGKICLNMIVKNEAHFVEAPDKSKVPVIKRCLDSVGHLLDAIAIVDTGSSDKTIEIIESCADDRNLPCEVIVDPWRDDFAYSRNVALDHSQNVVNKIQKKELKYSPNETSDLWYCLFMDADNLAFATDGVSPIQINKDRLGADAYEIEMKQGGSQYGYVWLVKIDPKKPWKWYSPRHEYITPLKDANKKQTWEAKFGHIDGYIDSRREGARSLDAKKYLRDAIAFEKALIEEPIDDRYLYYLAQSYKDAAKQYYQQASVEKEKANNKDLPEEERTIASNKYTQIIQQGALYWNRAEKAYVYRASVPPFNYWDDEYTYNAWVEAGKIRKYRKGGYDSKCLEYFSQAHQKRPHRLEAPYYILEYYLQIKGYRVGWAFAKDLVKLPYPKGEKIFVDDVIHNYNFVFQASLLAYYANAKDDFVTLSKLTFRNPLAPENIKDSAKSNLEKFGK